MTDSRHRPLDRQQAADRVHVSISTINMWVRRGSLTALVVLKGKHYYRERDVLEAERANRAGRHWRDSA